MTIDSGLSGSSEDVMHRVASLRQQQEQQQRRGRDESKECKQQPQSLESNFALLFRSNGSAQVDDAAVQQLSTSRLERAIGVQYLSGESVNRTTWNTA